MTKKEPLKLYNDWALQLDAFNPHRGHFPGVKDFITFLEEQGVLEDEVKDRGYKLPKSIEDVLKQSDWYKID